MKTLEEMNKMHEEKMQLLDKIEEQLQERIEKLYCLAKQQQLIDDYEHQIKL